MMMIIKKRVSYSNSELDNYGMPTNYNAYYIIGREANAGEAQKGDGIAKIYILSLQATQFNPDFVIAAGGAEKAVEVALGKLRTFHQNLEERIYIENDL